MNPQIVGEEGSPCPLPMMRPPAGRGIQPALQELGLQPERGLHFTDGKTEALRGEGSKCVLSGLYLVCRAEVGVISSVLQRRNWGLEK